MSRRVVLDDGRNQIIGDTRPGLPVLITGLDGWFEPSASVDLAESLGDGGLVSRARWESRVITLSGHWSDLDEPGIREALRVLTVICQPRSVGMLSVSDEGQTLTAAVVRRGALRQKHNRVFGWIDWEIELVAPDPYLYGPARALRVSTPAADYGLDWPLFTNGDVLTWGSGADLTVSGQIVNEGNAPASPTVTVYGDFPSGVSVGDGSGKTVTFAGVVTPQAPLVLDFAAHTATVGGEDRSHMLTGRGFFQVPPGGVLRPVLRAAGVGSGYADLQLRSTYI